MGTRIILPIFTLLFLLGMAGIPGYVADTTSVSADPSSTDTGTAVAEYANGYVLVSMNSDSPAEISTLNEANSAIGANISRDYTQLGMPGVSLIRLPESMPVESAVSYYQGIAGVAWAEPDYYRDIFITPSDPEFWRQWGLSNTGQVYKENNTPGTPGADIKAPSAWDTITGGNKAIVAVLDTGVDYRHPDLAANIWTDSATGVHGYDAITGTSDPMDENNHGTHCAGIIGAVANNGIGGSGVLWNATILPVRFISSKGTGTVSDEISGILWASQQGARVFSCSFGQKHPSETEKSVIARTPALFVIAAGNDAKDTAIAPEYPSGYNLSNIISVAALAPNDTLSWFSNYGNSTVHLAAPGSYIYSTIRSNYQPTPVFYEPFTDLSNWTSTQMANWTLDNSSYVSAPTALMGRAGSSETLTLTQGLNTTGMKYPVISYYQKGVGLGIGYIEGSNDMGLSWIVIDSTYLLLENKPFELKQAQLPNELQNREIMLRIRIERGSALIDDLMLSDGYGTLVEPRWDYFNGTSMATPMVSGIATMLMNAAPDASIEEIRTAILTTTDPVPALQNKLITGGRVNLTGALNALKKHDAIPLMTGWNHISVPRFLSPGFDTARIFEGVNSSGHSILMYQNDTSGYRILSPNDTVIPLQGYWIYSAGTTSVPVRFAEPVMGTSRNLSVGWSSTGGWGNDDITANETFHSLQTAWTYAVGYHAQSQQYEEPIIRGGTGNQSDIRPIHPYQGYWIYCSQNGTYQSGFG